MKKLMKKDDDLDDEVARCWEEGRKAQLIWLLWKKLHHTREEFEEARVPRTGSSQVDVSAANKQRQRSRLLTLSQL